MMMEIVFLAVSRLTLYQYYISFFRFFQIFIKIKIARAHIKMRASGRMRNTNFLGFQIFDGCDGFRDGRRATH